MKPRKKIDIELQIVTQNPAAISFLGHCIRTRAHAKGRTQLYVW